MKNLLFFVLALAGGILGSHLAIPVDQMFGATTARTTITNQWTFSATTTMNGNLTVTTADTATSTLQVGCIQMTGTSTATAVRLALSTIATSSPTYTGVNTVGLVGWQYGKCPRI